MLLLEYVHILSRNTIWLNKIRFTCKREHDAAIKIMCMKICEKWKMLVRLKKKEKNPQENKNFMYLGVHCVNRKVWGKIPNNGCLSGKIIFSSFNCLEVCQRWPIYDKNC